MRARLISFAIAGALVSVIAVLAGPLGAPVGVWPPTLGLGLMAMPGQL